MKLIILAFILSLSLHFLFISSFNEKKDLKEKPSSSKEVKKSSVNFVRLLPKAPEKVAPKTEPKKVEAKKAIPKEYKKVEAKKIIPQKKTRIHKKAKKIIPKPVK
ncbi:MAG: hypothetical protein WBF48_02135, partial [Halarcobacter sp.]